MALSIDKVYRFVQFVANKESRGWISPEEFNVNAELAQIVAYSKREAVFLASKQILNDMRPFMKNSATLTPVAGIVAYPADMRHFISGWYVTGSLPINEYTQGEWKLAINSTIIAPTALYPGCVQRENGLEVSPATVNVEMEYLASPVAPQWNYTVSASGRPVYSESAGVLTPTGSVDFGFDEILFLEIAMLILANCGVNLGMENVAQYGMAFNKQG
jgi:hypothetical protein